MMLFFIYAYLQLWRHGDRGLNRTYPTDPNQEDAWRYGWQELTPVSILIQDFMFS